MALVSFRPSVFSIDPTVYKTDRFNELREDISNVVTDVSVDGDKDRAGSKLACNVNTFAEVLEDGDWIAPYVTITPEVGDIIVAPMGHFRIDPPTVEYGSDGEVQLSASGVDILDVFDKVKLNATFFTPQNADPMQDVRQILTMATRGFVGPNLVQNPSFEIGNAGAPSIWVAPTWQNSGTGVFESAMGSYAVPTGTKVFSVRFAASQPANATAHISQDIAITPDMIGKYAWISGMFFPARLHHRGWIHADFYDAGMGHIKGVASKIMQRPILRWVRESVYTQIPENTAIVRLRVYVRDVDGAYPSEARTSVDDVAFHVMTNQPVHDTIFELPEYAGSTTSRIQSTSPDSHLRAADDRLIASGHHRLFPTFLGHVRTRQIVDLADGTVNRTYEENDIRIVSQFRVERSVQERFNVITAISDDTTTGVSLKAVAINDDADDKFSAGRFGMVNDTIAVPGAVSVDELYKVAKQRLDEASTMEELVFSVLPDTGINFNDIIEIKSSTRAGGRWEVATFKCPMSSDDPLLEIRARRVIRK